MSAPSPRSPLPLPTGRGWWLVVAGIASGVLAFLALLLGQREGTPEHPDQQPPAAAAPAFSPLPAPSASDDADEGQLAGPAASGARIEEPPQAVPLAGADNPPATGIVPAGAASPPVPIESPGPRYPSRALRRGESGEVLLRVQVDVRGIPTRVEVASSSGSRDLDRAARTAVERWRFRPAMRGDQPEAAVVNVPVTFAGRR